MKDLNVDEMNKNLWILNDDPDEGIIPVHHHSNDEKKDFLVDASTNEVVTEKEASERTINKFGRRNFLMGTGAALSATFLAPSIHPRYAFAADAATINNNILIVIFARGAMDGLNVVGPYNDSTYLQKRKTALVTPSNGDFTLNDNWALNKSMAGIKELWDQNYVNFVTSVGFTDNTRSHFFEQAKLERSAPVSVRTGWLGRYLMAIDPNGANIFTEMAFGRSRVASTQNVDPIITSTDLNNFTIGAGGPNSLFAEQLRNIGVASGGLLGEVTTKTLDAMKITINYAKLTTPENGAVYDNNNQFGINMHQIANIIKANVGLKVVAVDIDGWDTHGNEVATMTERLSTLSKNILAFKKDLGELFNNVTMIVQSEFGRTTLENGNMGCDHGYGNTVLCISKNVTPKSFVGKWNGLSPSVTDKQGDIIPVNDHRDVMAEVLVKSLGATPDIMAQVFPNYTPTNIGILQ